MKLHPALAVLTCACTLTACSSVPDAVSAKSDSGMESAEEIHDALDNPDKVKKDYVVELVARSIDANVTDVTADLDYDQAIGAGQLLCDNDKVLHYFKGNYLGSNDSIQKVYKYKKDDLNKALEDYEASLKDRDADPAAIAAASFVTAPFACPDRYTTEDTHALAETIYTAWHPEKAPDHKDTDRGSKDTSTSEQPSSQSPTY